MPVQAPRRDWVHFLPFLVLALSAAALFGNTLGGSLHLDDVYRIGDWSNGSGNPALESVLPLGRYFTDPSVSTTLPTLEQYRPLLPLSLALSHALSDASGIDRLAGLHLGNIAVHVAACCFLYLLFVELLLAAGVPGGPGRRELGRLGPARSVAMVAAWIYCVHPVSGVAVNYLCARDLLLMQAFSAAGLWIYVRMRRRSADGGDTIVGWLGALLAIAFALLSKTNALIVPLVILSFELLLAQGRWRGLRALPFAALSIGFYLFTEYALEFSDAGQLIIDRPLWEYPLTQLREHTTHYLRNAVAPFWLRPLPLIEAAGSGSPWRALRDPGVLVGGAVVLASLVAAWRCRRRRPLVSFCILSYWFWMALTSSIAPLRQLATDYRQAPALPFLVLLVVAALRGAWSPTLRKWAAGTALFFFFTVGVWHHNPIWATEASLWGHSVGVGRGGTFRAHMNFAQSVQGREPQLAESHYRTALEMCPWDTYSHINLGLLQIRQGESEVGLASIRRGAQLAPNWPIAHFWLGNAYEQLERFEEAADAHMRAADLQNDLPRYLLAAARSARRVGRLERALDYLHRLHAVSGPSESSNQLLAQVHQDQAAVDSGNSNATRLDTPEELYAAGLNAQQRGSYERALQYLNRLHEESGPFRDSLFVEGFAHQKLGHSERAVESYRGLLELLPDHVQVTFNLAYELMERGESEEAATLFERCLVLDSKRNDVHHWLARVYEDLGDNERAAKERALYAAGR